MKKKNWDRFNFYVRARILEELREEGIYLQRQKFNKLEAQGYFTGGRTVGGWRRYTDIEARAIKNVIREYYGYDIIL